MARIRNFWRLPAAERRLLLKALLLVASLTLGLRLLPFQTLRRWLANSAQPPVTRQPAHRPNPAHLARTVRRVSRYIPAANCLPQALATQWLLQRHGYPAELRIGVIKNGGGQLEAHAWVESEGRTVIGWLPDLARYTPLPSLDEVAARQPSLPGMQR